MREIKNTDKIIVDEKYIVTIEEYIKSLIKKNGKDETVIRAIERGRD